MSRTNEAARAVKDDLGILLLLLLSTELMMYDLSGSSASLVGWLGVLVGCLLSFFVPIGRRRSAVRCCLLFSTRVHQTDPLKHKIYNSKVMKYPHNDSFDLFFIPISGSPLSLQLLLILYKTRGGLAADTRWKFPHDGGW